MKELQKLSKEELIKIIVSQNLSISLYKNWSNSKLAQIKHFRIRIKKVRDSLDYLLKHPFSKDTSTMRRKVKEE